MTLALAFETEIKRVYAVERRLLPALERLEMKASEYDTRLALQRLIDSAPARLMRIEMIHALSGWTPEETDAYWFSGWLKDVDDLVLSQPSGAVGDAIILAMLLKITRSRTACYEAAYVMAVSLGFEDTIRLISALWREYRDEDENIANVLIETLGPREDYDPVEP